MLHSPVVGIPVTRDAGECFNVLAGSGLEDGIDEHRTGFAVDRESIGIIPLTDNRLCINSGQFCNCVVPCDYYSLFIDSEDRVLDLVKGIGKVCQVRHPGLPGSRRAYDMLGALRFSLKGTLRKDLIKPHHVR